MSFFLTCLGAGSWAVLEKGLQKPSKRQVQEYFTVALFQNNQPKLPTVGKQISQLWWIHILEYYAATEKEALIQQLR